MFSTPTCKPEPAAGLMVTLALLKLEYRYSLRQNKPRGNGNGSPNNPDSAISVPPPMNQPLYVCAPLKPLGWKLGVVKEKLTPSKRV